MGLKSYFSSIVLVLVVFYMSKSESTITPCRQYKLFSQAHYYVTYYSTSYSCGGWWSTSYCYRANSRISTYYTYYTKIVCCPGYGGEDCEPICSVPCGINKECTSPQTCTCENGWEGSDCRTDINECTEGTDECQYHDTCANIAGSYNCDCLLEGDKLGLDGLNCIKPVTSLSATPHTRDIVLKWSHPENDAVNGSYEIDCIAIDDENTSIPSVSYVVEWIETFKVHPVTPFTSYICSIKPVTDNGVGNPTSVQVEVLQDKPDGPPTDFEVNTIDSMIMQISWQPPEVPNGIIEYYKLHVNYTNSTRLRKLKVDPEFTTFFLEFLNPYQLVGISISAATVAGEGPPTIFKFNRTHEAEPGRVHDMDVTVTSANSAHVSWKPPKSLNGIVLRYHISLFKISLGRKISLKSWELESDEELSVKVFDLEPYIPYEFIVVPATRAGKGEIAPFKFFTEQNVPKNSPVVNRASRVSATEIIIEWDQLTSDDLQGFFVDYIVKYYTTAVHSDCSSPMDEKTVTTTDEYVLLTDLDSHSAYCVQVAAASTVGPGNYTSLLYVDMYESSKFELHLNEVHDCKNYVQDENTKKLADIAEALSDVCNRYCRCGIEDNYFGNMRFQCDENDNNKVIFQGSLIGTPDYWSYYLIQDLEQWKNSSPIIVVEGLQLQVDSGCQIALDDFGSHTQCTTPVVEQLTDDTSTADRNRSYIAVTFSMIVFALIAVILGVVLIIIFLRVKHLKQAREVDAVRYEASTGGVTNPIITSDNTYDDVHKMEKYAKMEEIEDAQSKDD